MTASLARLIALSWLAAPLLAAPVTAPTPDAARPLRELYADYFPLQFDGPITPETWAKRKQDIRDRVLLAAGLLPLPTKTPLNAVIHGRIERDDYTIDRVFFESFPGHYVTGSLYLPKKMPADGKMPGVLCPHGHWPQGRFCDYGEGTKATIEQLAMGAERFENGARSPLQARCVQLARMGCAVFFYDTLGQADSIQIPEHRSGRRPELAGAAPGTFGLYSPMADLRLQSNFGLQTWNSVRALDFLLTIPGVDSTRLSCTGASGGGTQTMILAAIEERLTSAFPCVMVSTAMQGGCTCENGNYLRINQGNIDIAAAFAPKPMGMTAADDWTKELATKGFPDLKTVWTKLGQPDNVMATFNIHWKHNYNHVSRTTMYGFMNKHFNLGLKEPVLERDFVFSPPEETTVWSGKHAKPTGDRAGPTHEKALLKHWSEDSDRLLGNDKASLARGWELIVGRTMPRSNDVVLTVDKESDRGDHLQIQATANDRRYNEAVACVILQPKATKWNGTTVLWLAHSSGAVAGELKPAWKKLLAAGVAVALPNLYMVDAKEQPRNPVKSEDPLRNDFRWAASYTYGYNHSLVVHRVHDAMSVVAGLQSQLGLRPTRVIVAGTEGAGAVAALASATMSRQVHGAVFDTENFRFASLNDQWSPLFVPGAVKYGDVPGLLGLCAPLRPVVLGEKGVKGGAEAVGDAVLQVANRLGRVSSGAGE